MISLIKHRERLVNWLLNEQEGTCPLCKMQVYRDIDAFDIQMHPDLIFRIDIDKPDRYDNQFVGHGRCNLIRGHERDVVDAQARAKKKRMERWGVKLNPSGNFRSASKFKRTDTLKDIRRKMRSGLVE